MFSIDFSLNDSIDSWIPQWNCRWQLLPGEDVRIAQEAKVNRQSIALRADRSDQTWLSFGDAIRVILPAVEEDGCDTCICTCVRPGHWEFLSTFFFGGGIFFELFTICNSF